MKNMKYFMGCVFAITSLVVFGQKQQVKNVLFSSLRSPIDLPGVSLLSPEQLYIKSNSQPTLLSPVEIVADQITKLKATCPLLTVQSALALEGNRETNQEVFLKWEARHVVSNSQFVIERSVGDTQHFATVRFVSVNERYKQKDKYDLIDANNNRLLSFYRVKVTLQSGDNIYSNIARVEGYSLDRVAVFPNPAVNKVTFLARAEDQVVKSLSITDLSGKTIWQQAVNVKQQAVITRELDISAYAKGVYMVKFEFADKSTQIQKFIKQ